MTDRSVEPTYVPRWFSSWKLSAIVLVFFTVSLIVGLFHTKAPLLSIYFPGAFIAMGLWSILQHFVGWRPPALLAILPVPIYLIAATTTLFIAFTVTDRGVYRHAALGSLIMTVPFGGAGIALFLLRHRLPDRRDDRPKNGTESADAD